MTKKVNFQSIDVTFPETLIGCSFWGVNKVWIPFVLHGMYDNLDDLLIYSKTYIKALRNRTSQASVLDQIIILNCKLDYIYPLHKSMWKTDQEPAAKNMNREMGFLDAVANPELYKICVTPILEKEGDKFKILYTNNFAFLIDQEKELDEIMKSSDSYVSPEAKHCAIYTLTDSYYYDIGQDKEIIEDLKN